MRIEKLTANKKDHLDLLLLADEQEDMIDKYLGSGSLFALYDDDLRSLCVVTEIDEKTCELKNIATYVQYQRKGYARALINHISQYYKDQFETMVVGTGDIPSMASFYGSCGFVKSHHLRNFFVDNYDHPIFEEGVQLIDMVYYKKKLNP